MANSFGHNFPNGVSNVDIPGFLCDEEDYCPECGEDFDECSCNEEDEYDELPEPDLNAPDAAERAHYLDQARRLK